MAFLRIHHREAGMHENPQEAPMSRIPDYKVDQSSFTLVGTKLYSEDLAAIWVRETVQNSVDAGAKNVTITYREARFTNGEKGNLDFEGIYTGWSSSGPKLVSLVCDDDGCGMDEDVLLDDFLRLGGSFKPGNESVGGFGVAKAIVLCGQRWNIHTNDLHLDASMMGKEPVRRIEKRDGTRIEMRILLRESMYRWTFSALRNALQLCDLPGVSIILKHENERGTGSSEEKIGRLRPGKHLDDLGWATVHNNSKRGKAFKGVHVRARGLWQFTRWVSNDVCVFIDIPDLPRAQEHDYPFTLSREGLVSPYAGDIDKIVERLTVEPSKARRVRDLDEELVDIWFPETIPDVEETPHLVHCEEPVRMAAQVGGEDVFEEPAQEFVNVNAPRGQWNPYVGTPNPTTIHGSAPHQEEAPRAGVLVPVTLRTGIEMDDVPFIGRTVEIPEPILSEERFVPLVPFPFVVMKQRRFEKRSPERHIPTMRVLSVFHALMAEVMDILDLSVKMDRDYLTGIVLSTDVVAMHMKKDDIDVIMISGEDLRWDDDPNILMPRLLMRLAEEITHSIGHHLHDERMVSTTMSMFDGLIKDHHGRLVGSVRRGREEYEDYSARRKRHLAGSACRDRRRGA